jgi:hypothetical protein
MGDRCRAAGVDEQYHGEQAQAVGGSEEGTGLCGFRVGESREWCADSALGAYDVRTLHGGPGY